MKKRELFKIEGENIRRDRKHCPKCGPGVFLAKHKDRESCGKCGYTEFKAASSKNNKKENNSKPLNDQINKEKKDKN